MSDEMDEIWALYADDGAQALDAMETALLALGDGGAADAGAHVGALFRAVHTFKGNSRVLGLSVVESRAHYAEDLIGLVRDQGVPWDAEIKDILLLASDTLRVMLEETAATRADVAPDASEDLMRQLKDKIARASGAAPAAAAEPAAQPEPEPTPAPAPEAIAAPEPEVAPEPEPEPAPEPAAAEPANPKKRGKKAASPEAAAAFLSADEPVADPEPAPAPEPEPAAEAAPKKRLADDPAYREIFRGMAADATRKLTAFLAAFDAEAHGRARKEADNLRHAATQMGLDDWATPLSHYIDGSDASSDALSALLAELATLTDATFGAATPAKPEPKPAPQQAAPSKPLGDDPAYREIFKGMATDAQKKLSALLAAFDGDAQARARKEADNLRHAARQMGMDDWSEALTTFLHSTDENSEPLAALLLALQDLAERTFGTPKPAQAEQKAGQPGFFDRIRDPLADIARYGTGFFCGETPDPANVADRVDTIRAAAQSHRYVRVDEAAARIPAATTAQDFHAAELRLYEELAGVEAVMPEAARASGISPREMLQGWCAEHVFSTLSELEATLERLKEGTDLDSDYLRLDRLMRLVHHACGHHGIETAGQLAMSLIDLFSRLHTRGQTPDAILSHVARGFIDTVEIVFDAITQGQTPDTASLEKLFEEASNLCFVQDGLMTASAIERRLGLPKEFHRVLSPESVRAASECIEQGMRFFIVRADINSDESLAEAFIGWLSSDVARSITNVTVFQGEETLFDFLLASALDEAGMGESLAALDPAARKLKLTRMLVPTEATPESAPIDPDSVTQTPQAGISAEMVEQIGEIAASQSMISHMLAELAEGDLFDQSEAVLRAAGGDWKRARPQMRSLLTGFTARLQELAQLETQLVAQITRLQEETVEIRSRRIETIFRPLEAFIQTYSRKNRREAATSFAGGDLTLDLTLLENLRRILRNLAVARLELGQGAPRKIHVSFHRDEERVLAVFEDDGAPTDTSPALDELRATVTRHGGDLRVVVLPGTGIRVHISLPLAMVVLEGMVVGVEGVRYVVPVDAIRMILQPESDRRIRVSAAEGREMLRIAENEIVAVRSLPGPRHAAPVQGERRSVYVVVGAQGRSVAVPVDELIGQQLVLLRPLKGVLSGLKNMTGIALLAGGDVGMVVSANMLCATQATHAVSTSLRM